MMICNQWASALLGVLLTFMAVLMIPVRSFSQNKTRVFSGICKICHIEEHRAAINWKATKKSPAIPKISKKNKHISRKASLRKSEIKELTFITLDSRGQGVKAVGEVYEVEGSMTGKVAVARLAFRDEQGMRLICEFGKYPPKGAEVLLGNKAYRMWKSGMQWNMRNVQSINGISTGGNVFIAEYFVKLNAGSRVKSTDNPEAAAAPQRREEPPIQKSEAGRMIIQEDGNSLRIISSIGSLTISHIFKGRASVTLHEASLKAYPEIVFQEIYNTPLAKVKEDILRSIRGVDGNFETNFLFRINQELGAMFSNHTSCQLASPDNRIITGVKIMGDSNSRFLYYSLHNSEWMLMDDDTLGKLFQSRSVSSYATHSEE